MKLGILRLLGTMTIVRALALPIGAAQSADRQRFITFDAPGADTTANDFNGTFPVSINDQGTIAGYYIDAYNVSHGFLLLSSTGN